MSSITLIAHPCKEFYRLVKFLARRPTRSGVLHPIRICVVKSFSTCSHATGKKALKRAGAKVSPVPACEANPGFYSY